MKLKRIGITAMAFFLAVGSVTPKIAFAMEGQREILTDENPQWISPLWISISDISPRISSSGITLYPEAYIEAKSSTGSITHSILAYNNNKQWQDVGYSLSRYYYKHTYSMIYDKSREDFVSATADYTHTNGYDPTYIAKAPNYMNYKILSSFGNECWLTGRYYRESY